MLVDSLIPTRAIVLAMGASGLGKTPLFYQLAMAVASGRPFLGHGTNQGRALVLDFENGIKQVKRMCEQIAKHLTLKDVPEELKLWNANDPGVPMNGLESAIEIIGKWSPSLVIIDSLADLCPAAEEKNGEASHFLQHMRQAAAEVSCAVLLIHHPKKPSGDPRYKPEPLHKADIRQWMMKARGASALVNGSDVRIALDIPQIGAGGDLLMRGFARIEGEFGPYLLERVLDESGDPMGYGRLAGASLLPEEQKEKFDSLPNVFRFKTAKLIYGKGDQATKDFLSKCIGLGLIYQPHPYEPYKKIIETDTNGKTEPTA